MKRVEVRGERFGQKFKTWLKVVSTIQIREPIRGVSLISKKKDDREHKAGAADDVTENYKTKRQDVLKPLNYSFSERTAMCTAVSSTFPSN